MLCSTEQLESSKVDAGTFSVTLRTQFIRRPSVTVHPPSERMRPTIDLECIPFWPRGISRARPGFLLKPTETVALAVQWAVYYKALSPLCCLQPRPCKGKRSVVHLDLTLWSP